MKYLSFRILFFCIFLPPVCYLLTINMLERYLQGRETAAVNQILIRNQGALYEGRHTIKEEIGHNIREYLKGSFRYKIGIRTNILVKTKDDRILYPAEIGKGLRGDLANGELSKLPEEPFNYVEVASENYKIMNEGLLVSVDLQIRHNSWLSNAILLFYVFMALWVLQRSVKKGVKESEREDAEQRKVVEGLSEALTKAESKLREVEGKEAEYQKGIVKLKEDKAELSRDIDGLLEEMERQEAGLDTQRRLREELESEVSLLKGDLDRVKGRLHKPKQRKKILETTQKRFKVLYKNLTFTERAIEGFLSLEDEHQLKAEEVIHRLNDDESLVSVKRKVFGKGGKLDVLEADFSYSGRLYFQKDSQTNKRKIVAIGTKNTQEKDLAFIESMS